MARPRSGEQGLPVPGIEHGVIDDVAGMLLGGSGGKKGGSGGLLGGLLGRK